MATFLYKFHAMSTPCEITIYHDSKSKADETASMVLKETKRLEKKYNYFDENSLLSQLNHRQERHLDSETKTLLQRAKGYYHDTNHLFDVTIATIKPLYHDRQNLTNLKREKEALLAYVGCEHFSIKKSQLIFDNPYTKIDLGGFVKEYAVDRATMLLKKRKIASGLINFGGDIYALGKKPNGEKFKIGIVNPYNKENHAHYIEISNQALTTSASYERSIQIEESIYSHILSKEEMLDSPASVTVISPSSVESGVYSTAIMIDKRLKTKHQTYIID
jgi:thiamine biosynthesis lipoprotein